MIQITPSPDEHVSPAVAFSSATRRAIVEGVNRGDPVAELEYLGLSTRYINLLENCEYAILSLEQLVALRPDELLAIANFGQSGLVELMAALSRYDQLEETKRAMTIQPTLRPK
jgi:DNA-directed RNA polymerase alpha subunit